MTTTGVNGSGGGGPKLKLTNFAARGGGQTNGVAAAGGEISDDE